MNNLIGIIVTSIYIVVILITSKVVSKFGEEVSRKYVHILLCNIWFFYIFFIDSIIVACILPAAFVVINTLSYKFKLIKSMEREENDGFGTIYYAVSILIISLFSYWFNNPMIGTIGILSMGYGDGLAAIVGKGVKSPHYNVGNTTKSIAGSITMFLITALIASVTFYILGIEMFILSAIGVSLIAMVLEAISIKGLDNLTVPIALTLLTWFII